MTSQRIVPVPLAELDRLQVEAGLRELGTAHHLCGVAVAGHRALLLVRAPSASAVLDRFQPFVNYGCFGASVNLATTFEDGVATLVSISTDHPAFTLMERESIRIGMVHGGRVRTAFDVAGSQFASLQQDAIAHKPMLLDRASHFWEVLATCHQEKDQFPFQLTQRDRLAIGWVVRCRTQVSEIWAFQQVLPKCELHASDDLSTEVRGFVQALVDSGGRVQGLFDYLDCEIGDDFSRIHQIQKQWPVEIDPSALASIHFPEFDQLWERLPFHLWDLYLFMPRFTDYGRQVSWLDFRTYRVGSIRIDPSQFPTNVPPEDYWARIPHGNRVGWGTFIGGHDVYISAHEMENGWEQFAGSEDPKEALDCANRLFDEAVTNKRGTIPSRAIVELRFGPFTHLELTEFGANVTVALRTDHGEFYEVFITPKNHFCSFEVPPDVPFPRSAEIEGAVVLLLAAIVRDFWVVEERESVFEQRLVSRRTMRHWAPADQVRIVYLPRVQYNERPNAAQCNQSLGLHERRAHFVSPHHRRLGEGRQASNHQRILATMYGFDIQEGYTFVGPHERGTTKRETIYRSRSALQSLYTTKTDSTSGKPIRWFQFERDVLRLMESMGFAVDHIAAARHGDNGIDLFATKGSDLEEVNWVIQCKCWHPRRKISPNIVRELIGVLAGYPQGTRGMIIATCAFSSGAIEAANSANIRLMDGAEFSSLSGFGASAWE